MLAQLAVLLLAALASVSAFAFAPASTVRRPTALSVVKFDKATQTWFTDDPEEMAGASYGPIGSLYRAGPKPFFSRIFDADTYDQAVLKYMAGDGCDRKEAQGNMDAFLENPQDWAYQKKCEQNKGVYKKDYANANMEPKQVVLSTVWGLGVVYFIGNLIYTGVNEGMLVGSFHTTMKLLGIEA